MATTKILAIFTIILVVAEIVPALSDSVPVPQNDVSKLEQTMDHQNVYSRVKRQFSSYPNGRRNNPVPIIFGGGGFGGNNGGRGFGGMGFGGRGFGAGGGGFGGARGGFGGARGGFGGARGGFGGGGRGRG